jgi:hypothetical protein
MAVGVVNLFFLRVAEHAVSFRAFAEFHFRLGLVFRAAVRMPFQSGFAVGALDLFDCRGPRNAQDFIIVALISLGHGNRRLL